MTALVDAPMSNLVHRAVADVEHCNFDDAKKVLSMAVDRAGGLDNLPPRALAAYAVAIVATDRKRRREALKLVKAAVVRDVVDPTLYRALARIHLMSSSKGRAVTAIEAGLRVDPEHRGLLELRAKLGVRSYPVLRFLQRSNPLNVFFGRIRSRLTRPL